MRFIGIDNGVNGAIAVINGGGYIVRVDKMPPIDAELLALLSAIRADSGYVRAVLEFAQAFPKMGTSSAFNYGKGYGSMQMALHAAGIPFEIVVPRKWQAALGCLSGRDKNITKRRAQQLFPSITVTHAIADALLMAEYCRRIEGQRQPSSNGEQHGKEEKEGSEGQAGQTLQGGRHGGKIESQRESQARRAQPGSSRHGAGAIEEAR